MITSRINDSHQGTTTGTGGMYSNRSQAPMRLNLNSVNLYYQQDAHPKAANKQFGFEGSQNKKKQEIGIINSKGNSSCNNIQSVALNDMKFQNLGHRVSTETSPAGSMQIYHKVGSASSSVTDRINYNTTQSLPQSITNLAAVEQRRSDVILQTPTITCFNCSSNLRLNELQMHHSDRCGRENPQVEGLDSKKAIQQIDKKFERINAYFTALLREQQQLGIKDRRALILKEIIQRALHCEKSETFQLILSEISMEFPPTITQLQSDYIYAHANQIKNIINLKLKALPQVYKSVSPLKQQQQPQSNSTSSNNNNTNAHSATKTSNNFFISNNFNQRQSQNTSLSHQRVQTEQTPRNAQHNLTEANIYQPISESANQGFHSPQTNNAKSKLGIFKLIDSNNQNSGVKAQTNLFSNYMQSQQSNSNKSVSNSNETSSYLLPSFNSTSNLKPTTGNSNNASANMDYKANMQQSQYQLSQSQFPQNTTTSQGFSNSANQFSIMQPNFKHIPTFQISLNNQYQPSNTQSTNSNTVQNSRLNVFAKENNSVSNRTQNSYSDYHLQQPPTSANTSNNASLSQNKFSQLNNNSNALNTINNNGLTSPSRFTFANNIVNSNNNSLNTDTPFSNVNNPSTSQQQVMNSPFPLKNIPSFNSSVSNNYSSTLSTTEKSANTPTQQMFFPPAGTPVTQQQPQSVIPNSATLLSNNFNIANYNHINNFAINKTIDSNNTLTNTLNSTLNNTTSSQFRSVSPSLSQNAFQFDPDYKITNKLLPTTTTSQIQLTNSTWRASSPQPNMMFPKPCFNSPQHVIPSGLTPSTTTAAQSYTGQRVLNFDLKDLERFPTKTKNELVEEAVKKNANVTSVQNGSSISAIASQQSFDIPSRSGSNTTKNELLSKLIQKQKDLQNLQLLSQQLKSSYQNHQEEINKVYNINNLNTSRSQNNTSGIQGKMKAANNDSNLYSNPSQENYYSNLLKQQQPSSHNNSTEITQTSMLSYNQLGSLNEILSEEDKNLQAVFFNLCVKEKMLLPKLHLAQKLPISLLFKEALEINIRDEESMRYFIQYTFENATTYIDIDKLKKSNKNQIFKNNLANKVLSQQPQ